MATDLVPPAGDSPRRPGWRDAALAGAAAWATYALLENLHLVVFARLTATASTYRALHVGFSAALLALYPALGAALGLGAALAAHGLLHRFWRRGVFPGSAAASAGALPLPVAVGLNMLLQPAPGLRLRLPVLALAGALTAIHLVRAAGAGRVASSVRVLASPWVTAALLVTTPWTIERVDGPPVSAGAAALAAAGAIVWVAWLCSLALRRAAARGDLHRRRPLLRAVGGYLLAAAALLVFGAAASQTVRRVEARTAAGAAPAATPRPNLILITLDTVRADHLSLYGYEHDTTPELRRLAATATVYARAIAPTPMTLGTHASLFTGLFAQRHGARYDRESCPGGCALDEGFETLAERLAANGYRTAAVVSNYGFLGQTFRLDQGFEVYDERAPAPPLASVAPWALRDAVATLLAAPLPAELSERVYRSAAEINRAVFERLAELAGGPAPFFLFVNYMDAHEPYLPPPPYDRLVPGKDPAFRRFDYARLEREVLALERKLGARERAHLVSQYDGSIAYLDAELGRLFARLRRAGLFEDALVVVTSDHGEAFGERGFVGHQSSVYQDQIHVPLVVKWPRQRERRRVEETVSLVDLFPTLLAAAGCETPPDLDGVHLLHRGPSVRPLVISEFFSNYYLARWHPRFRQITRAALRAELKVIVAGADEREAYALASDPRELSPLDPGRDDVRRLAAALAVWLELFPGPAAAPATAFDAETRARLRALGYL